MSVWWDRQIPHGTDFSTHLQQQLDASKCIMVLWSQASVRSQFVRDEATEGLNGRLVPALLEVVKPPLGFRQLQGADLSDWRGHASHPEFQRLLQSVRQVIGQSPVSVSKATGPALAGHVAAPPFWLVHRQAVLAVSVVLVLVAGIAAFSRWRAEPEVKVADTSAADPRAIPPSEKPSASAVPLDDAKVAAARAWAAREPSNPQPRIELGNLHFDAEQWEAASTWYIDALRLSPDNVDVITDLGVCYYYLRQIDKALAQFERGLRLKPDSPKTLLNSGIVKAFGKQDMAGARADWQRVVALAPDSPEGATAAKALSAAK